MAMEMDCGALVSDFQVNEIQVENVNIWKENAERAKALEDSCERVSHSIVEFTHGEHANNRKLMKRPKEERNKWKVGLEKEFKDFEKRSDWKTVKVNTPTGRRLMGFKWAHKPKKMGSIGVGWLLWVTLRSPELRARHNHFVHCLQVK